MKLRYYLRGLGTGILVTALILGRLISAGRPLTDAEIRAKALTLGMVDANSISLSDVGGNGDGSQAPSGTSLETGSPEPVKTPEHAENGPSTSPEGDESPEPDMTDEPEGDGSPEPDTMDEPDEGEVPGTSPEVTDSPRPMDIPIPSPTLSPSPATEADATQEPGTVETVTIVISRGDSSYTVCRKLEEAGLVEDAREFDSYLTDRGYSRTIRTGTYRIPVGSSWEEIAEIIA